MLVSEGRLNEVLNKFKAPGFYALDTETTGLKPYLGDRLFSIILANDEESYYFNFNEYPDLEREYILRKELLAQFQAVFGNPESTWVMHNAKFDMGMLYQEGLEIKGKIHCTEITGKIVKNNRFSYELAELVKEIGLEKSNAVENYIKENKLFEVLEIPGKKKKVKNPFYSKVPWSIIVPYGEQDARITLKLARWQVEKLLQDQVLKHRHSMQTLFKIYHNEQKLVKTCFEMEKVGAMIDYDYTLKAFNHEVKNVEQSVKKFKEMSGFDFVDSSKVLEQAFTKMGEKIPRLPPTPLMEEKAKKQGKVSIGNPTFTDEVLEGFNTPLAKCVQEYRAAYKKAYTYYRNFLDFADTKGFIHANIRQAGTDTGRFSYSEPNLQNLNKEEDTSQEFLVRRCFVPSHPDYCFVMMDYDQMEFRLMLDYAGQIDVIEKVLGGMDVHTATAEMMHVDRSFAKTLNFMLIYGGGAFKLALKLGISLEDAKRLKSIYFEAMPNVVTFINKVITTAKGRQKVVNWAGREYDFPDVNFAYKAPNYIIQGGCADIIKFAMPKISEFLHVKKARSKMLIQVHDELLFEMHKNEFDLIHPIKDILQNIYPHKRLPLTCGVDHSYKSWADKVEGFPK